MNITNTLIRLRDDLKEWVSNNILALHTLIPTKISDLTNDENYINEDYIEEMQLTLGVHTDGLVYLFKNNKPIGNGIQLGGEIVVVPPTNLMKIGEIYLNQRYSKSGGGLVSDDNAVGMFSIIFPFETDGVKTHTLRFDNLKSSITVSNTNTLFLLDSNKKNPMNVNGANEFPKMTQGVTVLNGGTSATVEFVGDTTKKYIVINLVVKSTEITLKDIEDYIITLD